MEEIEGYTYSEDWKNRCLVRQQLINLTDKEIGDWLIEMKKDRSFEYISKIKKLLNEEWIFITKAMKKRKGFRP